MCDSFYFHFFSYTKAWLQQYGYVNNDDSHGVSHLTDLAEAVRKFQRFVGLPVTGKLEMVCH